MKILLSNDDGVNADGIHVLADMLADLASIVIVAPDRNRSGASNSLTLEYPLRVNEISDNVFSVQGTPADCVQFALNTLLKEEMPDLVFSGINHGANLGDDVIYSGTVAAAMEGHFLGLQSISLSLVGKTHFDAAARVARSLVLQHIHSPMPKKLINVNVPDMIFEELGPTVVTRLGTRRHSGSVVCQKDPRGQNIYWIGPPGTEEDAGEGTDFFAIKQGAVSITPLQIDLTAHQSLTELNSWLRG